MHYTESGTGQPVLLLHAFPLDSRMWDDVREPLTHRVRLITPDQRGFRRTPLPADAADPELGAAAADVLGLLDEVGLDRVVLGGCSMGGYLAMAVLRRAPERVAGLIFSDTKVEADPDAARANRFRQADRAVADGIRGWLADEMLPGLLGETTRSTRPAVAARVRALIEEQSPDAVRWALHAMAARPDSADVVAAADVPALILVGAQDTLTPPALAEHIAAVAKNPTLVELPACGHLPALEDPNAFAAAVTTWLDTHDLA